MSIQSKLLAIIRGQTIRHVWRIPLVVGTILTLVNQTGPMLRLAYAELAFPLVFNFVTPFVVASLGFLRAQDRVGQLTQRLDEALAAQSQEESSEDGSPAVPAITPPIHPTRPTPPSLPAHSTSADAMPAAEGRTLRRPKGVRRPSNTATEV